MAPWWGQSPDQSTSPSVQLLFCSETWQQTCPVPPDSHPIALQHSQLIKEESEQEVMSDTMQHTTTGCCVKTDPHPNPWFPCGSSGRCPSGRLPPWSPAGRHRPSSLLLSYALYEEPEYTKKKTSRLFLMLRFYLFTQVHRWNSDLISLTGHFVRYTYSTAL